MAAKYPDDNHAKDLLESQKKVPHPSTLRAPCNTLVLDETSDDITKDVTLRGSQVATVYVRSFSEGSGGETADISLNIENSNFAKLFLLSTNICQDVMREIIRRKNPTGPDDPDLHKTIQDSSKLKENVDKQTRMLLYPEDGSTVNCAQLDFTAMYKIARHALPSYIAPNQQWSNSPKPGAKCLMTCIENLRIFRNSCSHSASGSISNAAFQTKAKEVTEWITQIENLLQIPNKYTQRVKHLTRSSFSPRVTELEAKSVNLEKQIDRLKKSLVKQTEIKEWFEEWKKHKQELLDVHSTLEHLYEASSEDSEVLPLLQRNLCVGIGDVMKEKLLERQADEQFFVETKGTRAAMKILNQNKRVIIAGRKGKGKERLAHHLLLSLLSKSECQTYILDCIGDVKTCFKEKSDGIKVVLIHDVFIDIQTKRIINRLGKDIFTSKSNRYLIITSLFSTRLSGLENVVNLSNKEYELSPQEKTDILRAHLDQCSTETFVSKTRLLEKDINEIVDINCLLEFPLACWLFTSEEKYYAKGVNFFRYPVDYFLAEIRHLAEHTGNRMFFHLLLLQDLEQPLHFVNEEHGAPIFQDHIKERLEMENLEISDLGDIGEELSQQGILIHSIRHTQNAFTFSNETVQQAAQLWLLETNFDEALDILSSDALLRCVIVTPRSAETCLFKLNSVTDQQSVVQKVLNDISKDISKNRSTKLLDSNLDIWSDFVFVDLFVCILFEKLEQEPEFRSLVSSILTKSVQNRLHVLCMAIVKKFKTSKCFARDSERLVSQTLLEACRIEGSIKIVQELAICEADLSFCKACRPGSEAQHISPLECAADANDHETVHFLLESGATIPHSKWRFWDFVKVAAEKQDTFLCNIMFIKSLSMFCRNKPISVNSALEKFTEKALKLNPESESDRKQFFFDCLILIGINPDLYSAFTTTFFHGERLPKGDRGENPCHMVLESSLNHEREFRTLGTLANEEFEMLNEKDNSGHTPLAKAVILGKSNDILSQMLLQIANADLKDSSGRTALHLAITSPNEDRWVLKFVNALASPNITCEDIMTAIPIQLCISKGRHRKETLRRLLAVNEKENKLPLSLLHHCINSTIPEEEMLDVMSVLKEFGADLNTDDDCNCKPIATATKRLYMNVMDTLMSWNAAIEDIDGQKNTILHYCCYVDAEKGNTILDAYNKYHSQNVTAINKQNDSGKTALMAYLSESAIRFDTKIIWRLLNLEPDLSIQDAEGDTVLHYLMQSTLADGDVLNFTQVMVNDFCLSVSVCNARDLSPLMCALTAKKSRFETVKFILSLQDGVKPRCPLLPEEMGILHHCINSCMSDDEVHEISHMLIEQWGISANKPDTTGVSPLSASIKHSLSRRKTIVLILKHSERELCTSILSDLIKHDKLDADIVDAMQKENIPIFKTRNQIDHSVFHYLINNARHFPTFQDLLVSFLPFGHDINHVDSEGFSPLYRACRDNCPEPIVSSLLSNGANVHLTSREESALHLCVQSKRNDADTRTIALAILGSSDININARDSYYETAVASAVRRGKVLTVKTLLEHGADPNIPDRENKTTLHHCVEGLWSDQNTCEFLHLLLPKVHIDQTDGNKCSALNVAASHSSFSRIFSILTLITAGSNIKTVDRQGRSPLHNTVKCLTSQLPCCKLERICRLHVFLSHGMSPVCEDNDKENAINVCIKENMQDEKNLLNKNLKALAICEKILRTNLVEVKSDTHNFTCTENIITRVLNDEMCEMLKDIASRLHEKDISSC